MANLIFTKLPKRGDIVLGDLSALKVLFVRNESVLSVSDIDTEKYEIIGVVVRRKGRKVLIAYKTNSGRKWSQRYSFKLTGYTLDGTDRTGTLNIRESSAWGTAIPYTISYNATTEDDLCSQLNAYFTSTDAFTTQDWYAENNDGEISLHFTFSDYRQASNNGSAGFTLTANLLPDVVSLASMRRKHGGNGGEGAVSNYWRALYYFNSDNSSTTYNPNADVTSIRRTYPLCLPAYLGTSQYQSDHCALLRATYGEGEDGWKKFIESCTAVVPCDFGNMGQRDGLARTKILAEKTYNSNTVTDGVLCPAANYAYNIETTCIPKGNWYLPTTEDIVYILQDVQYSSHSSSRTSDPLNTGLYKIGGSAISNSSNLWSCQRCSAYYAWLANGYYGFFSYNNMYGSFSCVPVSLYEIKD